VLSIADINQRLNRASKEEFAVLERSLCADTRKGVVAALERTRRRFKQIEAEELRLEQLYAFEEGLAEGGLILGLDEVGRGPLAGPLAVGAVVLPRAPRIAGLDDSKKVPEHERGAIAGQVKTHALAWAVEYIEADEIDAAGMALSLRMAFSRAIRSIEAAGVMPDVILLDGNPLHLDARELNVVKGDARCASIAAASLVAKSERDALMCHYALEYPAYGFEKCKGYASPQHREAIRLHGLCPLHRRSFCSEYLQESLF
jgi:ribonuclease HII